VILDEDAEEEENGLRASIKPGGEACKHLSVEVVEGVQIAHCGVHDLPGYEDTPCAAYDQVGKPGAPCRMGQYIRDNGPNHLFDLSAYVEGGKKNESC